MAGKGNLWPQTWYPLRRSEEIKPGQVLPIRALSEDYIIGRSPEGKAFLMEGHCTHRGASLGHGGTFVGNCVQCPFHGFQYDLSGKCVHVPNIDRVPKTAVLKTFPVAETLGMIWMFNGTTPTFPPPSLEGFWITRELPNAKLTTAYAFRNVRSCLMRDSICGSLDYQHANLVHNLKGRLLSIEEPTPHEIIVTSDAEYLDWGPFQFRRVLGKHVKYIGHYWGPAIVYTHVEGKIRTLGHIRMCLPIEEQVTQTDMLFVARANSSGQPRRLGMRLRTYLGREQDDEDLFLDHQKPRAMYIKNFDEGMIAHHRMCQRMGQTATVGREPFVADDMESSMAVEVQTANV